MLKNASNIQFTYTVLLGGEGQIEYYKWDMLGTLFTAPVKDA